MPLTQGNSHLTAAIRGATLRRMLRLFTAISVPWPVVERLKTLQTGIPGARWRPEEAFHITLAFYGEVSEAQADDLAAELARVRAPGQGGLSEIALKGVGAFGDTHRSRTLWAGVEPNEALNVLAGRCRTAAERAGVRMEARTYKPHLTLAYLDADADPARVGSWIGDHNLMSQPGLRIDRFGLYSSTLNASGSAYALEQDYPL
ncbi:RNA 2',3'-cyclic phosphodiesterase [soil metagenome]